MTEALGITTILKCLEIAEEELKLKADGWKTYAQAKADLKWFVESQAGWREALKQFDPEDLKGYATRDYNKLLEKMAEWDMKVEAPEQGEEGSVYAISRLLEKVLWKIEGEKIQRAGMFPEFLLEGVNFWQNGFSSEPLVSIPTQNGDIVWVTRCDEELKGLTLLRRVSDLVKDPAPWTGDRYNRVQIPCVKAEMKPSLNWLIRTIKNNRWFVADAKQLVRFGMNEKGFIVLEETSMNVTFECYIPPARPYILCPNGEGFIFGRTRPGVNFPVSSFHLTKEVYQDPGNLDDVVK